MSLSRKKRKQLFARAISKRRSFQELHLSGADILVVFAPQDEISNRTANDIYEVLGGKNLRIVVVPDSFSFSAIKRSEAGGLCGIN